MPVLFITAHNNRANPEPALAGGALAFRHIPGNGTPRIQTLDAALGRHGADGDKPK